MARLGEQVPLADPDKDTQSGRVLTRMMEALSPARLHFGWRVIEEVVRFMEQRQAAERRAVGE